MSNFSLALFYLMNTLGGLSNNLSWMLKIEPIYYTQASRRWRRTV